ncbi:complement factor H-like [Garra rufa]|uniref:complement factor H-like n=1 Tax=Garra rufa TaxID=137080 RepID=UPI003CCE8031
MSHSSRSDCPMQLLYDSAGPSHGGPKVLFRTLTESQMLTPAGLPPSHVAAAAESDPELMAMPATCSPFQRKSSFLFLLDSAMRFSLPVAPPGSYGIHSQSHATQIALESDELKLLSITALLTVLTSIKRVRGLQAFSVDEECLVFGPVYSHETLAWIDAQLDTWTKCFRSSEQLCYRRHQKGKAIAKQRLALWIVDAICLAYQFQDEPCPLGVRAYSTRGVSSSWYLAHGASLADICRAAGWVTPNTSQGSTTFAYSQFLGVCWAIDCLRENIKYANTELAEKASYPDGESLKVSCMTGYTGLYKLKCEKGEWKNIIERQCAKRKCSHPGDTPNGDFTLTEGTEFVFGATVVYTCKKGYEMASRINQRTCRAQGWDNAVPVCEVVKCPAVRTDGDVTASGNTEEGNYGDVINFECVSSDKMITGSSEIHCEETGKWSGVVPKCKDITCTAPDIPNGQVVEQMSEYKKDAILKYKCNQGFRPKEGIPRCAKFGWTLKPECDVTCELKSTTFGVKNINPKGKTIFRPGESVAITCSEKYWIFFTKETTKSFTCKDNGEWDYEPVCAESKCEFPRDQHVYGLYWKDLYLGEKQWYRCEFGYSETAEEATCTRDGWKPKPLCAKIMCDPPKISNADVEKSKKSSYEINSSLQYKCRSGFEPEEDVQITCGSQGQWMHKPKN